MNRITLCVVCVAVLGLVGGCEMTDVRATVQQIEADVQAVQEEIAAAKVALATVGEQIATLPPGEARDRAIVYHAQLTQGIASGETWLAEATAVLERLNAKLEGAETGFDAAVAAAESVAPSLPPPWGIWASIAANLLLLGRAAYNRIAARRIAQSLVGKLTLTPEQAAEVSAVQGAAAKRIVDEAQGKATALPI